MVLVVKIFYSVQKVMALTIFENNCSAKVLAKMNILVCIENFSLNQNEPKGSQSANFVMFSYSITQIRPFVYYRWLLIMQFTRKWDIHFQNYFCHRVHGSLFS